MQPEQDISFSVSDFVAVCNQTLEFAYPSVSIEGELANFRVSKNRWVYFDLKDENASVRFFGTVYNLLGPLEDGMLLRVRGAPRLHALYGFSVTVQHMQPVGEGAIRKAAELLQAKLTAEGLFETSRKRELPYPPQRIGLITSKESAAFADFMKILGARWGGMEVLLHDVQVQGEAAPAQIVAAIERFNQMPESPEVLVITRGGGSAEDLQAFSAESVTRAVAASRIPTLVAIGHEIDLSLAELAADKRASTPSNAAEFLTPDKAATLAAIKDYRRQLTDYSNACLTDARRTLIDRRKDLASIVERTLHEAHLQLASRRQLLQAINPEAILARGYAIVRQNGIAVRSAKQLPKNAIVEITFSDGRRSAKME
ncbi:MAG TPA: exodeoxyribonuclease VII large subunit [Candidatus Saccharimonadales bacterium]|nr:exodeoxyribonuclease VII large subunit [Candidatus Saccharimonadales bacterium]